MTCAASSFLMRSRTAGALSPTCSPSRTSGVRQSSCRRARIRRSMSSSCGSALPPNVIRSRAELAEYLEGIRAVCQPFLRGARDAPGPAGSAPGNDAARREVSEHLRGALLGRLLGRTEGQLGREGGLVGGGDAGELRDLARAGLLVETLHVPLLADVERAVDQDLDEVAGPHEGPHLVAVGPVGRDEGG